jgi:hypothetical protein
MKPGSLAEDLASSAPPSAYLFHERARQAQGPQPHRMERSMSAQVERLGREAMQLSPDERVRLVEIVLDSLEGRMGECSFGAEEEARLGELWDEGIASGPGEALSMEEIIARAKLGMTSTPRRKS